MAEEDGLRQILKQTCSETLSGQPPGHDTYKLKAAGSISVEACCLILATNTQLFNYRAVTLNALTFQLIEQTTTLADDFEQTTTRVVIFFVGTEMIR